MGWSHTIIHPSRFKVLMIKPIPHHNRSIMSYESIVLYPHYGMKHGGPSMERSQALSTISSTYFLYPLLLYFNTFLYLYHLLLWANSFHRWGCVKKLSSKCAKPWELHLAYLKSRDWLPLFFEVVYSLFTYAFYWNLSHCVSTNFFKLDHESITFIFPIFLLRY